MPIAHRLTIVRQPLMRCDDPAVDVSVVVSFGNDEERVGRLVTRLADHLRMHGVSFEIVAVDDGSVDNSAALLLLMKGQVPEARVLVAPAAGDGFALGARAARGRTLWLVHAHRADVPLAPFGWAHRRVHGGDVDVVLVAGRYLVCRRMKVWELLDGVRGRGAAFERRFLRRARAQDLRVETHDRRKVARRVLPFLGTLEPRRLVAALRRSRAGR